MGSGRGFRADRDDGASGGVGQVMALVAAVRAPGAVNLYDECDSMAAGDPAGLATARLSSDSSSTCLSTTLS